MSYLIRKKKFNKVIKSWKLKKIGDLVANYKLDNDNFYNLKKYVKLYLAKAFNTKFIEDDKKFIISLNKKREYRKNVTPNGGVVPKKEYLLEFNLILREWSVILNKIVKGNPKLLSLIRITPNIRIKFGTELEDNVKRKLNTSYPHSDAWLEGKWSYNCYLPLLGDTKKNTMKYFFPKKNEFEEKFLRLSKTYEGMQWVLPHYRAKKISTDPGKIYISDYAMLHQTHREKNCNTRISIDTTLVVGKKYPIKYRLVEYKKNISKIGVEELIKPIRSENDKIRDKVKNKKSFRHYTFGNLQLIKL